MSDVIPFENVLEMAYAEAAASPVESWDVSVGENMRAINLAHNAHLAKLLAEDGRRVVDALQRAGCEPDYHQRRLIQLRPQFLGWVIEIEPVIVTANRGFLLGTVLDKQGVLNKTDAASLLPSEVRGLRGYDHNRQRELLTRSQELRPIQLVGEADFEFQRARLAKFMVEQQLQLPAS